MTKRPLTMTAGRSTAWMSGILGAAVLVAGAVGTSPASAQEDNFTEQLLTTLGLVAPPAPDINYRERAPLVVPPSGDVLPPPRSADSITQNPAWPKDDDMERAKAEAKAARAVPANFNDKESTRALTPAEVARGVNPNAPAGRGRAEAENNSLRQDWLKPGTGGLGFLGWGSSKKEEKPLAFEGEPEREALVQPPPGYQTPAPGAAYGVVADRPEDKAWSLPNWFDRTQSNKDRN